MAYATAKVDGECDHHHVTFSPRKHPDHGHKEPNRGYSPLPPHKRGAAPPAHHTKGKLPSQLNPDHGPHDHPKGF